MVRNLAALVDKYPLSNIFPMQNKLSLNSEMIKNFSCKENSGL